VATCAAVTGSGVQLSVHFMTEFLTFQELMAAENTMARLSARFDAECEAKDIGQLKSHFDRRDSINVIRKLLASEAVKAKGIAAAGAGV